MLTPTRLARLLRRRLREDGGFTMVELLVTMTIIAGMLLSLLAVQTRAVLTTTQGKQRQQATAFANQALEEARALPYQTLANGNNSGALASDPYVVTVGGVPHLKSTALGIDEVLVTSAGQTSAPLANSASGNVTLILQSDAATGTVFNVRTYVTQSTDGATLAVTAIVNWQTAASRTPKTVVERTLVSSPRGCAALATRPFSGPCQAFLYGDSGSSGSSITFSNTTAGLPILAGSPAYTADLTLPTATADVAAEQATTVTTEVRTSGSTGSDINGTGVFGPYGLITDTALSGNDPAMSATIPLSDSGTVSQGSTGPGLVSGTGGSITLTPAPSDSGSTLSVENAGSPACSDINGAAMTGTGIPCGKGAVTQGGTASATWLPNVPGHGNLNTATIASVSAPASADMAWSGRYLTTGGTTYCTSISASNVGCVASAAKHYIGTATLGGLPSGSGVALPSGWSNMVSLTNFASSVASQEGPDVLTAAPTYTRTGTLTYWSAGNTATTVTLSPTTSLNNVALGTVTGHYDSVGSNDATISVTGFLTVTPVTWTRTNPDPACLAAGCTVQVTVPSIQVTLVYTLTAPGQSASFTVGIDLGSARSITTYKDIS